MSEDSQVRSVWSSHPANTAFLIVLGWAMWLFLVVNTDWMARSSGVSLAFGAVLVVVVVWVLEGPERLTFDGHVLRRVRPARQDQSLLLGDITIVEFGYKFKVGPRVFITGGTPRLSFEVDPEDRDGQVLLEALGERLEDLDMTKVIADEATRRALGIPGGGMRDPWTPNDKKPTT